jgi:hypothetical protein
LQVEQDSSLGGGRLGEYSVELHGCSSELGSGDRLAPCFCTPEIELVIDASRDINPIGYINDFRDQSGRRLRHPNAQFISILVKGWPHIIAMATEAVPMGGEILVDYGERFWTEAGLAD